jgi:hypothetical protein
MLSEKAAINAAVAAVAREKRVREELRMKTLVGKQRPL